MAVVPKARVVQELQHERRARRRVGSRRVAVEIVADAAVRAGGTYAAANLFSTFEEVKGKSMPLGKLGGLLAWWIPCSAFLA